MSVFQNPSIPGHTIQPPGQQCPVVFPSRLNNLLSVQTVAGNCGFHLVLRLHAGYFYTNSYIYKECLPYLTVLPWAAFTNLAFSK